MVATLLLLIAARQATPTDTVTKFVAAFNTHDFASMAKLCIGGKAENMKGVPLNDLPTLKVDTLTETVTGATADVKIHLTSKDPGGKVDTHDETDHLKLVSGQWLIVPAIQTDKDPGWLGVLAAIMGQPGGVIAQAHAAAEATVCLSNMKQIALGMFLYMNDHDEKFFKAGVDIHKALQPYLKKSDLWICPVSKKSAYSFNARLYGKKEGDVTYPANTVMFYEGANYKLDYRHDGKAAVAFADGHAKLLTKDQVEKLHWKP